MDAQRFVHRAVGKTEQHAAALRREAGSVPRRNNKMVARTEGETPALRAAFDRRFALAFDDAEHRAVGLAPGLSREARRQPLQEGGHGRHRRAAREWIDVAQLDAVPRVDRRVALELLQRRAAALVRIAED